MNELKEIFNMCDVMFVNADIDYNELLDIDERVENIQLALEGYRELKKIYLKLKDRFL